MGVDADTLDEQVADNTKMTAEQAASYPMTRQEAIQSLLKEIALAEKIVNKFVKVTEAGIFYKTEQIAMCKCSGDSLDIYYCMRSRLKMVQYLFKHMKSIAKHMNMT